MRIIVIIAAIGVCDLLIREFGKYAEEINPYSPDEFPKNDMGDDFNE